MRKAMKKTFLTAMAAVLALSGAGCGEQDNSSVSQSDSTPKEITVQAGYTLSLIHISEPTRPY